MSNASAVSQQAPERSILKVVLSYSTFAVGFVARPVGGSSSATSGTNSGARGRW